MSWSSQIAAMLEGAAMTAVISIASIAFGALIAFVVGLLRVAGGPVLASIALAYVEILRGTSLFVQLFWFYYALPLLGLSMSPLLTGILVLALHAGAYGAEIVRGAMQAVPQGQHEAARALNFGRWHTLIHILLPQAVVEMMPAFGNLAVETLKLSSLVSLISIADLSFKAQSIRNLTLDSGSAYGFALLGYFIMALLLAACMRLLEKWARRGPAFPQVSA